MPAVWLGVVLAIVICMALGYALTVTGAEFPQSSRRCSRAWWRSSAVGVLTSMVFWMKKAAKSIKTELHGSVDAALDRGKNGALGLVAMAFFAVGREGLESVFFLLATFQQDVGMGPPVGALSGRPLGRSLWRRHHLWRRPARSPALLSLDQRAHRLRGGGVTGRRATGVPRGGPVERAPGSGFRSQRRTAGATASSACC